MRDHWRLRIPEAARRVAPNSLTAYSLFLVLCVASLAAGAAQLRVRLRSEVRVTPGAMVSVGDIAELTGTQAMRQKAAVAPVMIAPRAGMKATVSASYIRVRLTACGLRKGVEVSGAETVCLVGDCVRVDHRDALAAAGAYLKGAMPKSSGVTYVIEPVQNPREVSIAAGTKFDLKPRLATLQPRVGRNTVVLDVMSSGVVLGSTSAVLNVAAIAEVLCASGPIKTGEALTAANATVERMDVSSTPDYLSAGALTDGRGWIARKPIARGAVVSASAVVQPPDIRKGDTVTLLVRCGSVKLACSAHAKQDGRIGEQIAVRSDVSPLEASARVVEVGLVEIRR